MRFTVSSSILNSKLQTLSKVINNKNSMPILDCFLFEVGGGRIEITASDSENTMRSTINIDDTEVAGRFAIANRTILDAMKELPEQPLTFDIDTENFVVKVLYQNGMYNFSAQNADEYPAVMPIGEAGTLVLDATSLSESISRSLFATAMDVLRPVMNGLYFDLNEECLSIVASDGHKLVRNRNYSVKSDVHTSFVLPKKPATLLKNVLTRDGGDVIINFNSQNAEIMYGDGTLTCRLIEGRYPNYNSVIPQGNPHELTIDRKTLLSAIRRVLPFASDSSQLVRFQLESGKLQLKSEDIDFATSAVENITCDYEGRPMRIGFKGSSLTEILTNLDASEVTLRLADPSRAGVITPNPQPENEDVLMLIMPMLLND